MAKVMIDEALYPVVVRHIRCGGIAFRMTHMPVVGEAMKSADCMKPDGTHPDIGEQVLCGTCGKPMQNHEFRFEIRRRKK